MNTSSPRGRTGTRPRTSSGRAADHLKGEACRLDARTLRAIFDHERIPILIYRESDGIVIEANRGATLILSATREAIVGSPVDRLLGTPAGMSGTQTMYDREIGHAEGGKRIVEVHRGALPGRREPLGFALLLDVTEQRRTEALFHQAQKMEVVGRLAGGIAHDFNNLVTIIGGYAEMLEERLAPEDPRRAEASEILRAAKRASDLTRQLLVMSRRGECDPIPMSPNEGLADMARMLGRVLGEDIRLEFRPGADTLAVLLDPGQFEQAILNLAVNARDAMPGGGTLRIETDAVRFEADELEEAEGAAPGEYARVRVRDTGCGIPREHMARLFEPFFTMKRPGEGTGLGLSLVYGIVRRHGGFIHVYSEPGQGTLFTLHFPACTGAAKSASDDARECAPAPPPREGGRILLVEDDENVRAFAAAALTRQGYSVDAVDTAEAARKKASAGAVDLVVSDVVLGGESGVSLGESLLRAHPGLRLLLTSGYPDSRARWEEIVGRGYHFLQKPYTARRLAAAVREALAAGSSPVQGGRVAEAAR